MGKDQSAENTLRFFPSRVEGLAGIDEITVYPDRIKTHGSGKDKVFRFEDIARWPRPTWLWKWLHKHGSRRAFLPVADRDWFHPNEDKYFAFYTDPPLVIYMPADSPSDYNESHFRKIQNVMELGGFRSYDLG